MDSIFGDTGNYPGEGGMRSDLHFNRTNLDDKRPLKG